MEAQDANSTKVELSESIDWFLDHLKVEKLASMNTLDAYSRDLTEILYLYGELDTWSDLTPKHLQLFDSFLSKCTSKRTAQRKASSFRSFLKFLKKNGVELHIDLPSTGGFKTGKRLPKALDITVMNSMLSLESDSRYAARNLAILELLYGAGLRVSELIGLETSSIDTASNTLRVTGKRNKTRMVPLPEQTSLALYEYLKNHRNDLCKVPTGLVFVSRVGKKLSRQAVYSIVALAARQSGALGSVGPHTLRHTYAVHLLKGGADLRAVQELLGHESVATTQVYTELQTDEIQNRYLSAHPRR
jgi:integrase/recombinase XerD